MNADKRIAQLIAYDNLQPHPEGGYYKETYRSPGTITQEALPKAFVGARNYCTAIYFLLQQGNFSSFHRINSDECWHFYEGGTLIVYVINTRGTLEIIKLGAHHQQGETYQAVVPAGCWFAAQPAASTDYALVGCTVAPGFDFADFELAKADELIHQYPQHTALIQALTRI